MSYMKAPQSFKLLNTVNPTAQHNIPEGLDSLSACGKLLILLNLAPNPITSFPFPHPLQFMQDIN